MVQGPYCYGQGNYHGANADVDGNTDGICDGSYDDDNDMNDGKNGDNSGMHEYGKGGN